MKKILSIIIAVVFVLSMTAIAVSAQSYNPNGVCDIKFTAKHADPANVIKDGIIGENEYERYYPDLNPDTSSLNLVFGANSAMYAYAEEMLATMEYYFSWDEIHGFNLAVRCKPPVYEQTIPQGAGDPPEDAFLCNLGLQVNFTPAETYDYKNERPLFYYAISKNATTGEYYEGHYNQLGLKGAYDPAPGVDYEISFGADGYITYEWSFALDNFTSAPTATGTNVCFTVSALAGTDTVDDLHDNSYGVDFGDFGFYVAQTQDHCEAVATLSDEQIGGTTGGDDSTTPGTNPSTDDPGTEPSTDNPGTDPKTDEPRETNGGDVTPINGGNTTPSKDNNAPSTADPIAFAAIVSAVSACGIMLSKKRK